MREKVIHERGSFLRDAVFSASDGLVTTFAVVAGSVGASLSPQTVLILGFANLFADGFSMSAGTYLGVKSEVEFETAEGDKHTHEAAPFKQGLVTFLSFDMAGLLPLMPYVLGIKNSFIVSLIVVILSMFIVGMIKGRFTRKGVIRSGIEMLLVGSVASAVAYLTGDIIERIVLR